MTPVADDHHAYMIQMFSVVKRFGAQLALSGVNLGVRRGEFLFLTGPSGAGKSTLLKLLYLAERASEGQILINGMNVARVPGRRLPFLRRSIGVVFQDYKLIPTKSVYENIALVLEAAGADRRLIKKKVRHLLRTVGLESKMDSLPPALSGGEQQRVALVRAIIGDPSLILADEPTGSLDADSADFIMDLLCQAHEKGATVIVATHDKALIERSQKRVVGLSGGQVVTDGLGEPSA